MRILAAAHDAGGAEVVSAWLRRRVGSGDEVCGVAEGPALPIFIAALGPTATAREVPDPGAFDLVVCGSSLVADLERRVVAASRRAGTRSAVWLDHWVNFAARFGEAPDEVWVCDAWARDVAVAELPWARPVVKGNPYLEDLVEAVGPPVADRAAQHVLYVTEPVSSLRRRRDPGGDDPEEVAALGRFLAARGGPGTVVRVRVHPAEPPAKYAAVVARHQSGTSVEISAGTTLVQDCTWADVVVGWQTMAMVVALHAGRRVLSVAPSDGPGPALPHPRQRTADSAVPWSMTPLGGAGQEHAVVP